jgi:hypothetical protein
LIHLIPATSLHIGDRHPDQVAGFSDQVIDDLRNTFKLTRQRTLRRRTVAGTIVVLLALLVFSGFRWSEALDNADRAERNLVRAEDELLKANINLAAAHEEKALALLKESEDSRSSRDYQRLLLQALQVQRQGVQGREVGNAKARARLPSRLIAGAFASRWGSPVMRVGSAASQIAFSPSDGLIASAHSDGSVRLWDLRLVRLLDNGPAPRAALISEALQRIWGLRLDGLDVEPETWAGFKPRNGRYEGQEVTIDLRPAEATADPDSEPIIRTFSIRPLFDPPGPGEDKLDQLLRWLDEQDLSPGT